VYGFSSELKTIDLMNQFAAFRKKHFEIIWVDDTHALAVFESPYLGKYQIIYFVVDIFVFIYNNIIIYEMTTRILIKYCNMSAHGFVLVV